MDSHDVIDAEEQTRSLRAPSSEPSLPRRDSTEDANDSFTRKRPRLDSGSRAVRSMSADRALSSSNKPVERDFQMETDQELSSATLEIPQAIHTPSRITINIREPQQAVNGESPTAMASERRDSHISEHSKVDKENLKGKPNGNPETTNGTGSSPPVSSPVVEIEVADPDDFEDDAVVADIHIDGVDDDLVTSVLYRFPYANAGDYVAAAEAYVKHIDNENKVDLKSLDLLRQWLDEQYEFFRTRKNDWAELYYQNQNFWELLGKAFFKLLSKSESPVDRYKSEGVESYLGSLFRSYILLVARLLQVDVEIFAANSLNKLADTYPMSWRHLRAASTLFSEEKGLVANVLTLHRVDVDGMRITLAQAFIEADGMRHLARYTRTVYDNIPKDDKNFPIHLNAGIQLAGNMSKSIFLCISRAVSLPQPWKSLPRHLVDIFTLANDQLNSCLDKQQDPLNCDRRKTMVDSLTQVIITATRLEDRLAEQLLEKFAGRTELSLRGIYPDLVATVWKIKLMKKYISKGRMDLRIQGIDSMQALLVAFFQAQRGEEQIGNTVRSSSVSPSLEFVADILLEEEITEYLVGVESHPQLIMRGYNVVGFLVVANKFSAEQADVVWRTIISSQDPRVVSATLYLLEQLTKLLTKFPEDVYFCRKILDSPLPAMSAQACSFFANLLNTLREEYRLAQRNFESSLLPLKLCIRLMCELSPTGIQGSIGGGIYDDAASTLAHLAHHTPLEVRKELYRMCIQNIKDQGQDVPASIQAIICMTKECHNDPFFLAQELGIVPILMDEFCRFVASTKSTHQAVDSNRLFRELAPRLDLILSVILLDSSIIDEERTKVFWNHLVGSEAINFTARDVAWGRLASFTISNSMENPFIDRCYADFLSPEEIRPEHYTTAFFSFVQNMTKYQIQRQSISVPADGGVIQVPGTELVWRALLTADRGAGEDAAMEFLASLYLDRSWLHRFSKASVEATHASLVDNCIEQLKSAHANLRKRHEATESNDVDSMDISQSPLGHARSKDQLVFERTMVVLSRVLLSIRKLPDFRLSNGQTIPQSIKIGGITRGDPFTIKCQFYRAGNGIITPKDLIVGKLDTCLQLHRRISRIASELDFSSFKIIWAGKTISLSQKPREPLNDTGIAKNPSFIVREIPNVNDRQAERVIPPEQSQTAFERRITSQFDQLYGLMDSDDAISAATHNFLGNFRTYEKVKDLMQDVSTPVAEVFPSGQLYKVQYSLNCLREVLEDKLEMGTVDDTFILHGLRLLESFVTNGDDRRQSLLSSNELLLSSVAIQCLFDFLQSYNSLDASPFLDPESLVKRVILIMQSALDFPEWSQLVCDSYEFLLEVSSVCPSAWRAFSESEHAESLHYRLLLKHSRPAVRAAVRQLIKVKIERFSSHPHLTKSEFANFVWKNISTILPRTVEEPQQSAELFETAELVLDGCKDDLVFSTEVLKTHFTDWSAIVTNHQHIETVGKDDADLILRGFAILLRHCAFLLFPNRVPFNQELVQDIWSMFLFPRASNESGYEAQPDSPLPVLESSTRAELIRLVVTLAEDDDALLEQLLELASEPNLDDRFRRNWSIDRSTILRSPTGYVGLRNLGNTCYMNSLLTQLFMNPGFRAFLLACRPGAGASNSALLQETQRLFAYMQNSYARSADASDFTCNIATSTEEPIDVREQMDVDEFMNMLFVRWEEQMPSNEQKEVFRSFYTGKTVQQIKSKECEHVSERDDTCLAIQCDVQGKQTLQESLQAFIEGDVMQGDNKYKCEPCGRLVDAVKRTCMKEVPDHLILQLKRFEYDLGFQRRSKINDLFEFPMTIDMSKYTFTYLADPEKPIEEDKFDLVGVIVHKGQADHGHYVSYIRARPTIPGEPPMWLQFDDADVTEFKPADIAEACYGGLPSGKDTSFPTFPSTPKLYNAYMLFYQRHSTIEVQSWVKPEQSDNPQHVPLPENLERNVKEENTSLLEGYSLFDISHRELVRSLLLKLKQLDHSNDEHKLERRIIHIAWPYIANVWCRTKELPDLEELIDLVKSICHSCAKCCLITMYWFANTHYELRDLLLRSSQPKVRQNIRSVILESIQILRQIPQFYGANISRLEPTYTGNGASAIIAKLGKLIPGDLGWNSRAWEDYWGLLADIADLGPQECWAIIQEGVLTISLELFLYHFDRRLQANYARVADLFRRRPVPPPQNQLIRLIARLFERVDFDCDPLYDDEDNRLRFYDDQTGLVPLTTYEYEYLNAWNNKEGSLVFVMDVFEKWDASREGTDEFAPGEIIRYLLGGRPEMAECVLQTFISNIQAFEATYTEPFMRGTIIFCVYSRSKDLVRQLVAFMAKITRQANPSNESDGYNGAWCLQFFQWLYQTYAKNLNKYINEPSFFYRQFASYVEIWAPSLLTFERSYSVGQDTYKLLRESLLKDPPQVTDAEQCRFEKQRASAIRKLYRGCSIRAQELLVSESWKQAVHAIICTMKDCQEYLRLLSELEGDFAETVKEEGDYKGAEEFRGFREVYETLPTQTDDDLGHSSELVPEWEELDIADDALGEASELTDVDVSEDELGS